MILNLTTSRSRTVSQATSSWQGYGYSYFSGGAVSGRIRV